MMISVYQIKIERTRARSALLVFSHMEKIAEPRSFIEYSILNPYCMQSMLNRNLIRLFSRIL